MARDEQDIKTGQMELERQAFHHRLIAIHQANLYRLEEQKAQHGMNVPVDLHSAIAYEENAIKLHTKAMMSAISVETLAELGPDGQFILLSKGIDEIKAHGKQRDTLNQQAREQRQQEVDQRDREQQRMFAHMRILLVIIAVLLLVIATRL